MSLPIKEVVRAYLMPSGMVASRRDLGMAVIMTPEMGIVFNDPSTRYVMASSADDVAGLFGSDSEVAEAARIYFAQRPQPQRVMIGRWARAAQEIAASSNSLRGSATKASKMRRMSEPPTTATAIWVMKGASSSRRHWVITEVCVRKMVRGG